MAKSRMTGGVHQGDVNPTGLDKSMAETLFPEEIPSNLNKVERDYLKGTGNRPSAISAVKKVRLNSTGNTKSPSTVQDKK